VSRETSVSRPAGGLRRTTAFGALLRLRAAVLRRRALTGAPLALERRRIAFHPKAQDYAIMTDYIRDLPPVKWASI
jgi:hypothetical protein